MLARINNGTIKLNEEISDYDEFQAIPVYAKKRKNKFWGKVRSLKDPQRENNKRTSQSMDILNKMDARGWFYDSETFQDPREEQNFIKNSSKPGFTIKVKDSNRLPIKSEGTSFPSELVNMGEYSSNKMKQISNIGNAMTEGLVRNQSGVSLIEQKKNNLTGNEFLFDNLSLAKRMLGRLLLKMIQKVYDVDRVLRIVNDMRAKGEASDATMKYSKQEIEQILRTVDLTKYDVVVSESANSPTRRYANFIMFMEAAGRGMQVPPQLLYELSDLPKKEKDMAIQLINQQQQAAAGTEQAKNQTEIIKTQIAAAGKRGGGV
jgi:hypothetical protein